MSNQLFRSGNSPTITSDPNNVASAVMERDANGDAFASGLHAAVPGTALPGAAPTSAAFLSLIGALMFGSETQTGAVMLATANKCIQKLNATGGAYNVTLPLASTSANLCYFFVKTDGSANVPTLKGSGSDLINAANTFAALTQQYAAAFAWCDGTQWYAQVFPTLGAAIAAAASTIAQRDANGGLTAVHYLSTGNAPTAAAGAGAGTSPPAPVVAASSNDTRGSVTGGTGTSPATGNFIAVTFNQAFGTAPVVSLTPANAATAALQPYVTSQTTTGFTIGLGVAPAASQGNTTYAFNWHTDG